MIGQILGHYRILDQLGAGGMGVVYRAHDEQLDRNVALKVLPPGVLADEGARKRFRQEALALAKLNHPNIETVYEFGSQDGVDYLAMELIAGQPLNEKLKTGAVTDRDLMRFGVQLTEGLAAAHEAGVIHSDLKPANIFVTPDNRLKILDFGLAKLLRSGEDNDITQTLTSHTDAMAGTLPYMSPEQLRGEETDARSDIYAAGTVLYEMATGSRPFPQPQAAQLIGAILHTEPPPPRTLNERIPPGTEAVILKSLDKSPSSRYQTAREFRAALETLTTTGFATSRLPSDFAAAPSGPLSPSAMAALAQPKSKTIAIAAGSSIAVVVLVALLLAFDVAGLRSKIFGRAQAPAAPPATEVAALPSVAVLPLVNTSKLPQQAWLSTALQQMLTTDLAAGETLRTISGEDVAQMKSDLALPEADSYNRETLSHIQKILGVDYVVAGSYVATGKGDLRLDLRLEDARSGQILAPASATGHSAQVTDLVDIVTRAGIELRKQLGIEGRPAALDASMKASMPSNNAAALLYTQGIEKLRNFDAKGAADLLQKAVKQDDSSALAHSALAEAWSALGYDQRAKDEDTKALAHADGLSPENKGLIQGRIAEFSSQWDDAANYYNSLKTLYSGGIDYGLRQAAAQTRGGHAKDALATLSALRATPGQAGEDPRIDLAEADADEALGDFTHQEAAAARAEEKATKAGMRRVAADADWHHCAALVNLGDSAKAKPACQKAVDSAKAVADPLLEARSLTGLGNALGNAGDLAHALEYHKEALQLVRGIGAQRDVAGALLNIAWLIYAQGDLKTANSYYQESLDTSRRISNKQGIVDAEGGLAGDVYASGDYRSAQQIYADMLKTAREIKDQKNEAIALNSLGLVAFQLGDLPTAKKYVDDSLEAAHKAGMDADYAAWLCTRGDIELAQDQLDAAGKAYQESQSLNNKLGNSSGLAQDDAELAILALERKDPQKAADLAGKAANAFHDQKNADAELDSLDTLIRALIDQKNLPEAHKALVRGQALPAQDQGIRLAFATAGARLAALEGQPIQGLLNFDEIVGKATQMHFKRQELETRLTRAAIALQSGRKPTALADIKSIQAEARAAGFNLLARKAAELANTHPPSSS
ncbi:MAG TPA: protein kinase [Candidatus Limnocylindrales bacterium]|nr:protein kinase [Candidatus Limnocylindrales bacterium]